MPPEARHLPSPERYRSRRGLCDRPPQGQGRAELRRMHPLSSATPRAFAMSTRRKPRRPQIPTQPQEKRNDASSAAIDRNAGCHPVASGHGSADDASPPRLAQRLRARQRPARHPARDAGDGLARRGLCQPRLRNRSAENADQPGPDWRDCPADASGFHAIKFGYDPATSRDGTIVAGHPAILTLLVDDAGIVSGLRIETDPKARLYIRKKAFLFGIQVKSRYGSRRLVLHASSAQRRRAARRRRFCQGTLHQDHP